MGRQKLSPGQHASEALQILGQRIRIARTLRRWSAAELAKRVGISKPTLLSLEKGSPSVSAGHYFEAATVAGVTLFVPNKDERGRLIAQNRETLALLPTRADELIALENTHGGDDLDDF